MCTARPFHNAAPATAPTCQINSCIVKTAGVLVGPQEPAASKSWLTSNLTRLGLAQEHVHPVCSTTASSTATRLLILQPCHAQPKFAPSEEQLLHILEATNLRLPLVCCFNISVRWHTGSRT
jgi:hypothetical protein